MKKQKTTFEKVTEFHKVFGHPAGTTPGTPSVKQMKFRVRFILEETVEHIMALGARHAQNQHLARAAELMEKAREQILMANDYEFRDPDIIGIADSLGDLDYVVSGAALTYGIDLPAVVEEIHSSNMSKLGVDGKPIYDEEDKVKKGPNYRKPDLASVLFPEEAVDDAEEAE